MDDPKDAKADAAALASAQQVLAQLKAGKDFAELARKYSADPGSSAQGGDLGWFSPSTMVPPFDRAAMDGYAVVDLGAGAELAAVRDHRLRLVALSGPEARTTWEQLEVVMSQWRAIEGLLDQEGPLLRLATRTSLRAVPLA